MSNKKGVAKKPATTQEVKEVTTKPKTKILRNTKNYRVEMTLGDVCIVFSPREDKTVPIETPVVEGIGIILL